MDVIRPGQFFRDVDAGLVPDFEWDSLVGLLLRVFFDNFLHAFRFPYSRHSNGCPEVLFL